MHDIEVSSLILAGGRATRMGGIAKHAIIVQGETILARQARVLRKSAGDDILVSSPIDIPGFRTVRDKREGIGPLGGIEAGLEAAATEWLLVVAGDMPYLSGLLIDHMIDVASSAPCDAVGIRVKQLPEPLFCVVRVSRAREAVARLFDAHSYKASALLDGLATHYVREARARACDPDLLTLHNINEPSDLR